MSFSKRSSPSTVINSLSKGPKLKKLKEIFVMDSIGKCSKIKLTVVIVFSYFFLLLFAMKDNIFLTSNGNVPNKANEPIKVGERMSLKDSIFASSEPAFI